MELVWSTDRTSLIVRLSGEIDASNISELENAVYNGTESVTDLVFDLENLEYISSSGLRVFLTMQKRMKKQQGKMIIKNPNDEIMYLFRVTGYMKLLSIEKKY